MGQARLIRAAFLLATATAFVVLPPAFPRGTVMSSLLDDLAPGGSPSTAAEADARANDRDWCHVNDFWTVNVGLYSVTGAVVVDTDDPAIKLIELSVAAADEPEK
jgi:hypothetical protein